MEYNIGDKLQFTIYGSIVEGIFMNGKDDFIVIKITRDDDYPRNVGIEQAISKSCMHIKI